MSEHEYKKWVLAAYEKKKAAEQLASELLSPTPARVKAESVRICEQRFKPGDEKILRSFFDEKDGKAAYLIAIKNCNAEIFKPVITFFTEKKLTSNLKNAEYLAWLLDFPARPYHPDLKLPEETGQSTTISATEEEMNPTAELFVEEPKSETSSPKTKKQNTLVLLAIGLALIVGLGVYLSFKNSKKQYTWHEGCMIWSDDHYEPTDCNDHSSGKPLYLIKHELVDHFKKIADPKTLTLTSLGKVWYGKYDGNIDFFTDSGPYPLDTNRRVLPMSVHIYQKYILHTTN
jgi:hypothetical protein